MRHLAKENRRNRPGSTTKTPLVPFCQYTQRSTRAVCTCTVNIYIDENGVVTISSHASWFEAITSDWLHYRYWPEAFDFSVLEALYSTLYWVSRSLCLTLFDFFLAFHSQLDTSKVPSTSLPAGSFSRAARRWLTFLSSHYFGWSFFLPSRTVLCLSCRQDTDTTQRHHHHHLSNLHYLWWDLFLKEDNEIYWIVINTELKYRFLFVWYQYYWLSRYTAVETGRHATRLLWMRCTNDIWN